MLGTHEQPNHGSGPANNKDGGQNASTSLVTIGNGLRLVLVGVSSTSTAGIGVTFTISASVGGDRSIDATKGYQIGKEDVGRTDLLLHSSRSIPLVCVPFDTTSLVVISSAALRRSLRRGLQFGFDLIGCLGYEHRGESKPGRNKALEEDFVEVAYPRRLTGDIFEDIAVWEEGAECLLQKPIYRRFPLFVTGLCGLLVTSQRPSARGFHLQSCTCRRLPSSRYRNCRTTDSYQRRHSHCPCLLNLRHSMSCC